MQEQLPFFCQHFHVPQPLRQVLTKVGSVKSGKLFVVKDTIMQAVQKTAINITMR